ncbi:MAG TPA: SDR family oxidoreductase [Rhodothermales bacterium]|nr:SDR family oxidoreductase [Rhodothermales bacterium]
MSTLDNQVAIVTGASSGIGEATARLLAAEGAAVVLAARREGRLHDLKDEIEGSGGQALVVPTDVTDRRAVEALAEQTIDTFGRIDILINNAGLMPLSFIAKLHVDEWEKMVDVNVKGVMYGVAAVLPTMLEQESGHIVNVSSVAGRRLFPGGAVYCATKFAVTAFSEGLRQELSSRHNIRVTCIEPGAVKTELPDTITDKDILEGFSKRLEDMTRLESEDIAESIRYAVSSPGRVNVAEVLVMPTQQG